MRFLDLGMRLIFCLIILVYLTFLKWLSLERRFAGLFSEDQFVSKDVKFQQQDYT